MKLTKPTKKEIKNEIKVLRGILTVVKEHTFSPIHNNLWGIYAQLYVLGQNLDREGIRKRTCPMDWTQWEADEALQARRWMDDSSLTPPHKFWALQVN